MTQAEVKRKLLSSRKDLLDIGLRNTMISFRSSAKSLTIVDERSEETLKLLYRQAKGMTFSPMSAKRLKQAASSSALDGQPDESTDSTTLALLQEMQGADFWAGDDDADDSGHVAGVSRRHIDTKLQSSLSEEHLFLSLLKIHTEAETYIQEQGVNVLFLALGFLQWYEADAADKLRKAPLLLVPVELKRGGSKDAFRLVYSGDELIQNLSLAAKLKTDFALTLPLYADESGVDPADSPPLEVFYAAVSDCVSKQKRWKVAPDEMALYRFVWNATFTSTASGGHPRRR